MASSGSVPCHQRMFAGSQSPVQRPSEIPHQAQSTSKEAWDEQLAWLHSVLGLSEGLVLDPRKASFWGWFSLRTTCSQVQEIPY